MSERLSNARRWVWRALLILFVLGLGSAVWVGFRGYQAYTTLSAAVPKVQELQAQILSGDQAGAAGTLAGLQTDTQHARNLTSDPVWWLSSKLPWAGVNLVAVAETARVVDDIVDLVMPPAMASADSLDLATMRPVDGRVDLGPIQAAAPQIAQASEAANAVELRIQAVDLTGVEGFIAAPVQDLQARVENLALTLRTGARATALLPPMLGADGPRQYILLLQTNAELRATGGLPGVISVVTADHGVVELTEQVPATDLPHFDPPVLPLHPEDEAVYSDRPSRMIGDVNFTPDFPTVASLASEMWRLHTGDAVDGVLATDPVALSYLLAATGPVDDGAGGSLDSTNAVDVLLSQAYLRYPDSADQDVFFSTVASNVFDAFASGQGSAAATIPALAKAAGERRLLVWSTHDHEQALLEGTLLAGSMPDAGSAAGIAEHETTIGVFFNDGTGAKMDYYLDTSVELVERTCQTGTATYMVRTTLASRAPIDAATSLPESVTGPGAYGVPQGSIRTGVVVVGALDGRISSVELDGNLLGVPQLSQDGRPATVVTVEFLPGEEALLDFTLTDPSPTGSLAVWSTPTRDKSGLTNRTLAGLACG